MFGVEELGTPVQRSDLRPVDHLWDELEPTAGSALSRSIRAKVPKSSESLPT